MTTDYVYTVIRRILSERVNNEPNNVPYNELAKNILEDMRMAVNQLVSEKRISYRKGVNDLLFYDNVGEAAR